MTYYIYYGFLSGPLHSQKFRKTMDANGLALVDDPEKADIIIAHSAGCWHVPFKLRQKMTVFIGPALAAPILAHSKASNIAIQKQGIKRPLLLLKHDFAYLYYGITQWKRNSTIWKQRVHQQLAEPSAGQVLLIANRDDPWPRGQKLAKLITDKSWAFIGIPGAHEDIWMNPEHYVAIIKLYAR